MDPKKFLWDGKGISFSNQKRNVHINAAPRTLYVCRKVLNAKDIRKWAKAQGFKTALPVDDMHVTVMYSETPVDWMSIDPSWCYSGDSDDAKAGILRLPPGGPRIVEALGPKGAVVLSFKSNELKYRHEEMLARGCTCQWTPYQPHVTITYQKGSVDVDAVEAYQGEIVLGPEIFEEITHGNAEVYKENCSKKVKPRQRRSTSRASGGRVTARAGTKGRRGSGAKSSRKGNQKRR